MKKVFLFTIISALGITAFGQTRIAPQKTRDEILNETYCTGLFSTLDATYFDFLDNKVIWLHHEHTSSNGIVWW